MIHQTEQLKNAEEKLDSINAMTKVTQRHITSLKSVFGAVKNRLFGKNDTPTETDKSAVNIGHSRLQETLDEHYGDEQARVSSELSKWLYAKCSRQAFLPNISTRCLY